MTTDTPETLKAAMLAAYGDYMRAQAADDPETDRLESRWRELLFRVARGDRARK